MFMDLFCRVKFPKASLLFPSLSLVFLLRLNLLAKQAATAHRFVESDWQLIKIRTHRSTSAVALTFSSHCSMIVVSVAFREISL